MFVLGINADGTADIELSPLTNLAEQSPAWDPDGRRIYLSRNRFYDTPFGCAPCPYWEILSHDLDSGSETLLTEDTSRDVSPLVSPDGGTVLFAKAERANDCCNPTNLWQMSAGGDLPVQVLGDPGRYEFPFDWHPDTGQILGAKQYGSQAPSAYEIVLFALYGSDQRLTDNGVYDVAVAFSPNGSQVLLYSTRSGIAELYIGDIPHPDVDPFQLTAEDPTIAGADWVAGTTEEPCEDDDSDSFCEGDDSDDSDDSDSSSR